MVKIIEWAVYRTSECCAVPYKSTKFSVIDLAYKWKMTTYKPQLCNFVSEFHFYVEYHIRVSNNYLGHVTAFKMKMLLAN